MTEEQQKEQFSIAYVRAIAAAACINIYRCEVDEDSIDLGFSVRSVAGQGKSPKLDAQLKCVTTLSGLVGIGGNSAQPGDELEVSFTWAKSRPLEQGITRAIVFPGDRFPIIAEAARLFRGNAAQEESEIRGVIIALKADQLHGPIAGPVTVRTVIDGRMRKAQITLDETAHRVAWQADESRAEVMCRGELVRSGSNWTLQHPRGFEIVIDE